MNVDSERNERVGALIAALDLIGEEVVSIAPAYFESNGLPYEGSGKALAVTIRRCPEKE